MTLRECRLSLNVAWSLSSVMHSGLRLCANAHRLCGTALPTAATAAAAAGFTLPVIAKFWAYGHRSQLQLAYVQSSRHFGSFCIQSRKNSYTLNLNVHFCCGEPSENLQGSLSLPLLCNAPYFWLCLDPCCHSCFQLIVSIIIAVVMAKRHTREHIMNTQNGHPCSSQKCLASVRRLSRSHLYFFLMNTFIHFIFSRNFLSDSFWLCSYVRAVF